MTVSSTNLVDIYDGDDSTRDWPITFPVTGLTSADIEFYVTSAAGVSTLTTNGVEVDLTTPKVIYPTVESGLDVLATGTKAVVRRTLPLTQEQIDVAVQGAIPLTSIETGFDRQVEMIQQLQEEIDRCVKVDLTASEPSTLLASIAAAVVDAEAAVDAAEAQVALCEAEVVNCQDEVVLAAAQVTLAEAQVTLAEAQVALAVTARTGAETAETNAGTAESNASSYASQAAASAAEGLYNNVTSKSYADTPITLSVSEDGTLFRIDTSGGNVVVNLSDLATYAEDMKFAFVKTTADGNTLTINRGGTDTIEGGTSATITTQYEVTVLVGDSATGTWVKAIQSTSITDGSVTMAKLADIATQTLIGRTAAGSGVPSAIPVSSLFLTGEIKMWPMASEPSGYLLCNGQAVSRSTYSDLFGVIGTDYGVGDGSTTFNVPNMAGKVVAGYDSGDGDFDLRDTGGAKTHALSEAELAAHNHALEEYWGSSGGSANGIKGRFDAEAVEQYDMSWHDCEDSYLRVKDAGSGDAHNNLQPYITLNYIIKT